jgi:dihydrofolate synthase/folylpolyglutamate synthase
MDYKQTLDFLFSQLPMFQRQGGAAYKANLNNTIALCNMLGNPQNEFPSIHIAGTNGKGSTSNMLASVFQEAGYKTGLYTSPHLVDFRERIRINGEMIPETKVVSFVANYQNKFIEIKPSFFEMTFAMAIDYFRNENVDIVIMETGMGGRLDSTNVVNSIISVITNIGMDHTQFLGSTLKEIAAEKAGIIKNNIPVVIGEYQYETTSVFKETALKNKAQIQWARDRVEVLQKNDKQRVVIDNEVWFELDFPIKANYQLKNLRTAIASLLLLKDKWHLSKEIIKNGLQKIIVNTNFAGRWQHLSTKPNVIVDTGHNVEGLSYTMSQLSDIEYNHLHFVLGMVNDKDIDKVLKLLPSDAVYYFCQAKIPRAMDRNFLFEKATKQGLNGKIYSSVKEAYEMAIKNYKSNDLVFVGGSTFVVAEVLEIKN